MLFLDTDATVSTVDPCAYSNVNPVEASLTIQVSSLHFFCSSSRSYFPEQKQIIAALRMCGVKDEAIGVISPFRGQVRSHLASLNAWLPLC